MSHVTFAKTVILHTLFNELVSRFIFNGGEISKCVSAKVDEIDHLFFFIILSSLHVFNINIQHY